MIPISDATRTRLRTLFCESDWEEAETRLATECADNLPLTEEFERIRFAVLKLSQGNMEKLGQMIDEAKCDWRDVLVTAGFAEDVNAHWSWRP
jgi:hypothetical protein